ncbi:hypothetical protein CTRI78_v012049 [Colletotrichum trifolii]|uniref:Uncharacterized protein n=1 Tax=Colletotrichum trifolii TaxID=5466 RepID=A0A4R8PZ32_COLTR|nr:hypothetical protein CTRI78_v012049 [Colletotrichum trifolii]
MPSLPVDVANTARDLAFTLIARQTGNRGSNGVVRTNRGRRRGLAGGIIAAIVVAVVAGLALMLLAFCLFRRFKRQRVRREQEANKYYGDNRSSMGTSDYPTANAHNTNMNQTGGYNYGQGYGYAHTGPTGPAPGQAPPQYGYGAPTDGGVAGVPPAHTAGHVQSTHH